VNKQATDGTFYAFVYMRSIFMVWIRTALEAKNWTHGLWWPVSDYPYPNA